MPLYLTASHSSRVRKSGAKTSPLRRASPSPLASFPRRKPSQRPRLYHDDDDTVLDAKEGKVNDSGNVMSLDRITPANGVLQSIEHSHKSMFVDIPERAGMNSTRIAEILNFRRGLPPIVSIAHIHGLITASTRIEREIASLLASGNIRRLTVPGRGNEVSGLSEFLVSIQDLERCIRDSTLDSDVGDKFLDLLGHQPRSTTVFADSFSSSEILALKNAGFLVSSGILGRSSVAASGASRLAPAAISRQASGTVAAAGGQAAVDSLGGIGSARGGGPESLLKTASTELMLSLPNTGTYLRLLNDARTHFLQLLGRLKHRQAPLYLIRERWDGAIESDSRVSNSKRLRGEFAGILPGRTKKWKQLCGLNFDWVLDECLGAGLVEVFDTGSVGYGIRAV